MDIKLRPGTPRDIEPCGTICYQAFKSIAEEHRFPPDFPTPDLAIGLMSWVFAHSDVDSVIAELAGRIVGSNFLWRNGSIAGVGPVAVDPSVQNMGVGRRMMEYVIDQARRVACGGIRLVQVAYHSRSLALYNKLGFTAREALSCFQGPPLRLNIPGHAVRQAVEADVESCNQLCFSVHGHTRSREVLEAVRRGIATVVEHDGRLTGYSTVLGFVGHSVAETNEDLKALIGAAPSFPGPGILVPTCNGELLRWCLLHGLRITQPLTLMSLGLYNEPSGAFLPSVLY
jgi:GNAT superfamily N-acetyltransferase